MKEIHACEVCGNRTLKQVLSLGMQPLCDDLVPIGSDRVCKEYPIIVIFCEHCQTAHQRFQVDKTLLFPEDYHYRARFTRDVTDGMEQFVQSCEDRLGSLKRKWVLDIGCNDGYLLDKFKERGAITFGIEPTKAAHEASAKRHIIIHRYFDGQLFISIKPDIVTFTNVFAHLDDLQDALAALKLMLGPKTTVVIENHYLGSILKYGQFDTFYHEHPRTYSAQSFVPIAESLGLNITHIEFPKRYGGNIRVFMNHGEAVVINEAPITAASFGPLAVRMSDWRFFTHKEILEQVEKYGPLPAIAFPGRASILLRLLGLNEEHISAVYQKHGSPKVGHYVPGTRIPILSDRELPKSDVAINLAWHISEEVRQHLASLGHFPELIDICSPSSAEDSAATVTRQPLIN